MKRTPDKRKPETIIRELEWKLREAKSMEDSTFAKYVKATAENTALKEKVKALLHDLETTRDMLATSQDFLRTSEELRKAKPA